MTAEDGEAIEAGRLLFAKPCEFFYGSMSVETLPEAGLPEVAFAGRSNVGKSSLLNALTGRNSLARASKTPGRTRQLNFFRLGDRITLVDMPGYGYADAPKSEIARWSSLITSYLKGRQTLTRVCLLVDARHGVKDTDAPMLKMLDAAAVLYQFVLTKCDKLSAGQLTSAVESVETVVKAHSAAFPQVFATSSTTGAGIAELRSSIAALALPLPVV